MIEIISLHKSLSGRIILRGVDLCIQRGITKVILGLSGSGKSVLMKHMIGLMRPDRGQIRINGEDITRLNLASLLQMRRRFGMVFQQAALFDSMTVFENIAFPLYEHTNLDAKAINNKVAKLLDMLDLHDIEQKYPAELSGGMRKRVGLARAVMLEPEIVLYDEPTTGLDPVSTENVDAMIIAARTHFNVTNVVISHDIGSALRIADEIAVLHEGKIVADGPTSSLLRSSHPFVRAFLRSYVERPQCD